MALGNVFVNPASSELLFRYLDTVGDGSGTKNANGDYSSAEEQFFITPPAGEIYQIDRMIVSIGDTNGFRSSYYGAITGNLVNGITVSKRIGTTTIDLDMTDQVPVVSNATWARLCYDADLKTWGAGDELLVVRWTFTKTGGALRLIGDNEDRLTVVLNDDLRGLKEHYFQVQGYVVQR
jgi:hypothetical protein